MSKYIIELGKDANMVQVISVTQSGNAYIDSTVYVGYLEQLNSDYINEHYEGLQDTAYQKGFEDGKKEAESSEAIEQVKKDAFNKGMLFKEEKIHDAFLRGVEKGKAVNDKGCEGCRYEHYKAEICQTCMNNYVNHWESAKQDDKIEVGDEVNWLGDCFIVTRIFQPRNMKEQCDGIDDDGCVYSNVLIDDLEKTGRHFDIASILEDMKHD